MVGITIEQLVEDHWQSVQLSLEYLDTLSEACRTELARRHEQVERDRAQAARHLQMLREQQHKLLGAHYANAIPLELLRSEQERLSSDISRTEARAAASGLAFRAVEANLTACLGLLRDCHRRAYRTAGPELRRRLNQAVFTRLVVTEDGVVDSQLEQPFVLLLQPDLLVDKALTPSRSGRARRSHQRRRRAPTSPTATGKPKPGAVVPYAGWAAIGRPTARRSPGRTVTEARQEPRDDNSRLAAAGV